MTKENLIAESMKQANSIMLKLINNKVKLIK